MKKSLLAAVVIASLAAPFSAHAGGLIGGLIDKIVPGAGKALDDVHRELKEAIPPYKQMEELSSYCVREFPSTATDPRCEEILIELGYLVAG